jgi:hypothetical protein
MLSANRAESGQSRALDPFDRVVILYLVLPLPIFLLGWLEPWAALPLVFCVLYALRPLMNSRPSDGPAFPVSPMQVTVAVLVGCGWTAFGGIGHFVFANTDWHIRDAVFHDLVVSPWPVGYGVLDGAESLLRAPLGYYLPAALVGKSFGLWIGHLALGVWTAAGATLFLLQALSLTPARTGAALAVAAVIVLFSGFDVVGSLISSPGFLSNWNITQHLEWWAGSYQYSSQTTQLFWVPNHALGGWLTIGLLCRDARKSPLDAMLPMIVVAAALWSPLSALGLVPFILLKVLGGTTRERLLPLLHPRVWGPALVVGLVIASFLTMGTARLPVTYTLTSADLTLDLLRQLQFFLLEAGFIGFVVLALRWSWEVVLALVVLLLLPIVNFGPGNDLVMRASIPSLAVLAIGACRVLTHKTVAAADSRKKLLLGCMLGVGAVTPVHEFARAIVLPAWPINMEATLIGAACGQYPPHYTARLDGQILGRLLRSPHRVSLQSQGSESCFDPAAWIMVTHKLP